jgi:hypothetical protein
LLRQKESFHQDQCQSELKKFLDEIGKTADEDILSIHQIDFTVQAEIK